MSRLVVTESLDVPSICVRCQLRPATSIVHDARGCVYLCRDCRAWREGQSVVQGHSDECPIEQAQTINHHPERQERS